MVYIEFGTVVDGWAPVELEHNQPETLTQEQLKTGVFVDRVPESKLPHEKFKVPLLFINPTTKEMEWRNVDRPLTEIEQLTEQLRAEQEKHKTADQRYQLLNPTAEPLEQLKQAKTDQLNEACEAAILRGFTSEVTGYFYAFSQLDQMNFMQEMLFLNANPAKREVAWKTEDAGVIVHTREQFFAIYFEAEQHKRGYIGRYRELIADVNDASTWQEVDAFVWD